MNQKNVSESVRFSPLALAIVLLSMLGLLAFRVHAQEDTTSGSKSVKETVTTIAEERKVLREEQSGERAEIIGQAREDIANAEDPQMTRAQVRDEVQATLTEQQEERLTLRTQQREEARTMLREHADEMKEELAVRKQERQQRTQEYKAKLTVQAQAHIGQYVERIVVRMEAAIERLRQIADRVSSRIDTMEEKGVDLSDARDELTKVYDLLDDAQEYVDLFGEVSEDTITSDTPSGQTQEVRDAAKLAKDAIVEVHNALSDTVQLIKASVTSNLDDESEDEEESVSSDDGEEEEGGETEGEEETETEEETEE